MATAQTRVSGENVRVDTIQRVLEITKLCAPFIEYPYAMCYMSFANSTYVIQSRFYSVEVSQALVARLTRVRFTVGPLLFCSFLVHHENEHPTLPTKRLSHEISRLELSKLRLLLGLASRSPFMTSQIGVWLDLPEMMRQKLEKHRPAAHRAISEHPTETVASPFLLPSLRLFHGTIAIVT